MTAIADSIKVHLPDGSVKEFPAGSTPYDVAQSISPRLAAAAVVARIRPTAAANLRQRVALRLRVAKRRLKPACIAPRKRAPNAWWI